MGCIKRKVFMELLLESINLPQEINPQWLPDLSIIDLDLDTSSDVKTYNVNIYKFNLDFKFVFWDSIGFKANFRSNAILNCNLDIYDDVALFTIESRVTAKPHEIGVRYQGDKWFTTLAVAVSPENKTAFNKSVYKAKDTILSSVHELIKQHCKIDSTLDKALIRICPKDQLITIILPSDISLAKPNDTIAHSFEINTNNFKSIKEKMIENNLTEAKLSQEIKKNVIADVENKMSMAESEGKSNLENSKPAPIFQIDNMDLPEPKAMTESIPQAESILQTEAVTQGENILQTEAVTQGENILQTETGAQGENIPQTEAVTQGENILQTETGAQGDQNAHEENKFTADKHTQADIMPLNQSPAHPENPLVLTNSVKSVSAVNPHSVKPSLDSPKDKAKSSQAQPRQLTPNVNTNNDNMPKYAIYSKSEVDNLIKLNIEAVSEQLGKKITNHQKQFQETVAKQEITFKSATDNVLKRIENIENNNKKNLDQHESSIKQTFTSFKEDFNGEINLFKTTILAKLTNQVKATEDNISNLVNKVKNVSSNDDLKSVRSIIVVILIMSIVNLAAMVFMFLTLKK